MWDFYYRKSGNLISWLEIEVETSCSAKFPTKSCNSKSERLRVINEGSKQESERSVDHLDNMFILQVMD